MLPTSPSPPPPPPSRLLSSSSLSSTPPSAAAAAPKPAWSASIAAKDSSLSSSSFLDSEPFLQETTAEGGEEEMREGSTAQQCGDAADIGLQSGSTEGPEVRVRAQPVPMGHTHALRRSRRSWGRGDGMGVEAFECLPELGVPQRAPQARSRDDREPECSQAGAFSGVVDENNLTSSLHEGVTKNYDHQSNYRPPPIPQPDCLIRSTNSGGGAPESASDNTRNLAREETGLSNRKELTQRSTDVEEIKGHQKFSYFATGMAGAGIFAVYSGYLGNSAGQVHGIYIKICIFLVMAAFASGAGLMLLTFPQPCFRAPIQIVKSLKYTSFVCLTLALVDICIMFLKDLVIFSAILAFTPSMLVLIIKFTIDMCENRFQRPHYQHNSNGQGERVLQLRAVVSE